MKKSAIIYCENEFGKLDGKVANGLVRHSNKYEILGVIDSSKSNLDAGEYLDGTKNGIPIFQDFNQAIQLLDHIPEYFIYGIAPLESSLSEGEKKIIHTAIQSGLHIVNGLSEFLSDDPVCSNLAKKHNVSIFDVRKPPSKKDLHHYTGKIQDVNTPIITVLGTDCAVGKRTTALKLTEALKKEGLSAIFITTGQTGILQGSKYGIAIDVLSSGYASGEVENAILEALKEKPDIIIVEGQGALSHPAFTSSCAIIRGAMPKAIILQHPPKRKTRCDFPQILMPTIDDEIKMLETFSGTKVIAITINHESMTDQEIKGTIKQYEEKYQLPVTDVLKNDCSKILIKLQEIFPNLISIKPPLCQPQE
ncbi:DUF1611 domain-containing protein [uncultured Aquimarina sp.]|uniref:DUF1611 domain-containing protein n=1 Tax=uncultured Aquimarina sp. TaxID=575652 RepID=UPI0026311987|nr:DUF1611 domain-containing protein [uncultured Aquimarina sp.]